MSVVSEKHRSMIAGLLQATKAKEIDWQINSDGDPWVSISSFNVLIKEGVNNNGEDLFIFDLLDSDWRLAERFNDENLMGDAPAPDDYGSWFSACKALRELAIRAANKSDEAVDSILEALDKFRSVNPWGRA